MITILFLFYINNENFEQSFGEETSIIECNSNGFVGNSGNFHIFGCFLIY